MSGYLLDTNVISELRKRKPEPKVTKWIVTIPEEVIFISSITLGELRIGIDLVEDRAKRLDLERWLVSDVVPRFAGRILAFDGDVADRWGRLEAKARLATGKLPLIDGMLAATALHHGLAVVTRNSPDFLQSEVSLVNPWA